MKFEIDEAPLPHEFHHPLPDLSKHPHGTKVLCQVRNMTLKMPWQYSHFGRDLYWLLAPTDFCLEVLKEWVDSTDELKFKGALALLTESASGFVFSRPDFVELVLSHTQSRSAERFEQASSALHFCATRHGESRSIGQPGPTTVATKALAAELAKQFSAGSMMASFYEGIVKRCEARLAAEKLDDEDRFEN
jgi:hypothetical protein